ncbi:asparaginase-domain-containing protein [Phlyctochytrium arcticum]|nr:asparaginase-domain-containing protein [Phlyctochytrium arcticum]
MAEIPPEAVHHVFVNDAVNAVVSAEVADDMISADISRVLVLYTGGTIGMKNTPEHGYLPVAGYLSQTLAKMTRFHDPTGFADQLAQGAHDDSDANHFPLTNAVNIPLRLPDSKRSVRGKSKFTEIGGTPIVRVRKPALITPPSLYGKRIRYSILEYDPLMDSSNMTMTDWVKIATDIEVNYMLFDAFIVLHGTDTMAFTASALSFMLEDLGKTVILSGSQVPLAEVRNDAVDNLLGALTIAGHFVIPEVGLFFNNKLYRGNRSSKVDAVDFNAFDSPNLRPLVSVGINIDVSWMDVLRPMTIAKFSAHKTMDSSVATLRLFPGITEATVRAFLAPPIRGVVLETYGSGNAPNNRPDILAALKDASDRGIVVVNCTQCKRGLVTDLYATGKALLKVGVVPGSDMTPECALTKLSYLLGKGYEPNQCRNLIRRSLRGELTVPSRRQRFTYQQGLPGLVGSVMALLGKAGAVTTPIGGPSDKEEVTAVETTIGMERVMIPMLMCQSARVGDIDGLQLTTEEYRPLINIGDYDGRTPLHIAAGEEQPETVRFLLLQGANVHLRDRFGHSPLWDAVRCRRKESITLLRQAGAHFSEEELEEATYKLIRGILKGDFGAVQLLADAGADLNRSFQDGRTPLHMAVQARNTEMVELLVDKAVKLYQEQRGNHSGPSSVQDSPPVSPSSVPAMWHRPSSPTPVRTDADSESSHTTPPSWTEVRLEPRDRWGKTPLDEAREAGEGSAAIASILEEGIRKLRPSSATTSNAANVIKLDLSKILLRQKSSTNTPPSLPW